MAELKPCPFCGSKPTLTHNGLKLTTSGASIDGDIITYWQPLPEPPKDGDTE